MKAVDFYMAPDHHLVLYYFRGKVISQQDQIKTVKTGILEAGLQNLPRSRQSYYFWTKFPERINGHFASEIIGYFKIPELENALCLLLPENNLGKLKEYPLNCIWAHSCLTTMESFFNFFMKTNNEENQVWVLFVYKKMPYGDENISDDKRKGIINKFFPAQG